MQEKFYIGCAGQTLGPYSEKEILRKVHNGKIKITDYIYLEDKKEWISMLDDPKLSAKIKQTQDSLKERFSVSDNRFEDFAVNSGVHGHIPLGEKTKAFLAIDGEKDVVKEVEWFVLRGKSKYGPFSVGEVAKMLRNKTVFEYDYAWNKELKNWMKISELDDFLTEGLKTISLVNEDGSTDFDGSEDTFFRRRHARVNSGGSVIIHNNEKVWRGNGVEISVGGAGIEIPSEEIETGNTLYLHFKPGDGMPSFNAVCIVINKRISKTKSINNENNKCFRYGMKFKSIGRSAKLMIHELAAAAEKSQNNNARVGNVDELLEKKAA